MSKRARGRVQVGVVNLRSAREFTAGSRGRLHVRQRRDMQGGSGRRTGHALKQVQPAGKRHATRRRAAVRLLGVEHFQHLFLVVKFFQQEGKRGRRTSSLPCVSCDRYTACRRPPLAPIAVLCAH